MDENFKVIYTAGRVVKAFQDKEYGGHCGLQKRRFLATALILNSLLIQQ
jgi:hypothetical protein